jgi:hypothetical protein
VLIGYFVMAFLLALTTLMVAQVADRRPSMALNLALMAATGLYAVVGGYVAGWVARGGEIKHALAISVVIMALSATMFLPGHPDPLWFKLVTIAVTVPMPLLGGLLRKRARGYQT